MQKQGRDCAYLACSEAITPELLKKEAVLLALFELPGAKRHVFTICAQNARNYHFDRVMKGIAA